MITYQFRRAVEACIKALFSIWPLWTAWSPTVTQSAPITATISEANYLIIGKLCILYSRLIMTGAGVGNNAVVVGGFPASIAPALIGTTAVLGIGFIRDTQNLGYVGAACASSATEIKFQAHNSGDWVGITPNFALAINDEIGFVAAYRIN